MRVCIIYGPTGVCENIVDADTVEELGDNYIAAPDNTGEIGWTWTGEKWRTPADIFTDTAFAGAPAVPTPAQDQVDAQIVNAAWVVLKVQDTINSLLVSSDYYAADYAGNGSSFSFDAIADDYTGANSNITFDIDGGTYA